MGQTRTSPTARRLASLADGDELAQLTAAIFHAIGRNLVQLQQMEGMLRGMVIGSDFSGPSSQLEKLNKKRVKQLNKASMGSLAGHFTDRVLTKPATEDIEDIPDTRELHFSFNFSFDLDPADAVARKRALGRIVKRRNKLVHGLHNDWNGSSIDSGSLLLQRLDVEYQEGVGEVQLLRQESEVFRRAYHQFSEFMQTPEFKRALFEAPSKDSGPESSTS